MHSVCDEACWDDSHVHVAPHLCGAQSQTTKNMMSSFLNDLDDLKWTEADTRKFCEEIYDDIGAHTLMSLEERTVSSGELKAALSARGHKFSEQSAAILMSEVDQNEDGLVAFSEFLDAMNKMVKSDQHQRALRKPSSTSPGASLIRSAWRAATACAAACRPPDKFLKCYRRIAKHCDALVRHPKFDLAIVGVIFIVAIATFLEIEYELHDYHPTHPVSVGLHACSVFTLTVFTLESIAKMISFGEEPHRFFTDPDDGAFNTFDLVIVIVSYATMGSSGGAVSVLRLLRLVKLMNKLPALREILLGLIAGVKAVASIMILMMLIMFFFSIVGNLLFSANDPVRMSRIC